MKALLFFLTLLMLSAPVVSIVLGEIRERNAEQVRPPEFQTRFVPAAAPSRATLPGEDSLYLQAARRAWSYFESETQDETGLANSVVNYPYATMWDMASNLAALYAAGELGLVEKGEYDLRMRRLLASLRTLPLHQGIAFNKSYQVAEGLPAARGERGTSAEGYGWSAVDLGRLLIWLKIVSENQPEYAGEIAQVVRRLDYRQIVRDGYLWGSLRGMNGNSRLYQEGRIGYEQYAAAGFALWGEYADRALRLEENSKPVRVLGIPLLSDRRGDTRLTSEPFFLMGIELGWWSPKWSEQAQSVLAIQEERFRRTRQVTMASEDALPVAPYHFYYYTIEHEGEDFQIVSIVSPKPLDIPPWVSTKAAFAWHALFPSPYTWQAIEHVAPGASQGGVGWSAGVYEKSRRSTGGRNLNTAAVILEAALYQQRRGLPLLTPAAPPELASSLPSTAATP